MMQGANEPSVSEVLKLTGLEPIDCDCCLEAAWLGQGYTILAWVEMSCKIK